MFCVSVTSSASLVKLTRKTKLKKKNPTLEYIQTRFRHFLCIDWDRLLIYFWNLSLARTFRKPGRHVGNFVCSHASQEYRRIFLDREPIRASEKHYSLAGCMLMSNYLPKWR